MCDYLGDGRFVSVLSGTIQQVAWNKRLVDTTFVETPRLSEFGTKRTGPI